MKKQQETDLAWFFIIAIILSAILYSIRKDIQDFWSSVTSTFKTITSFIESQLFFIILTIIVIAVLIYFIIKLVKTIKRKREERKTKTEEINKEAREIDKILDEEPSIDSERLSKLIKKIKEKIEICKEHNELSDYKELLEDKLKIIKKEKKNEDLRQEKLELQIELKELRKRREHEKQDKETILRKLDISQNRVFKKSELNDKQIEILKQESFEQVNQFDVLEKRFISVLIKPYENMNHSREHIFLVWSVKRLLEKMGIDTIEEHLTKGADITFKHNKKWFAIEIETGKLLKAPKQLREKVNYLNKQYPDRWLFIVSNEKLVSRYAEFGLSTPRNRVQESIEKLLKNA